MFPYIIRIYHSGSFQNKQGKMKNFQNSCGVPQKSEAKEKYRYWRPPVEVRLYMTIRWKMDYTSARHSWSQFNKIKNKINTYKISFTNGLLMEDGMYTR